MPQPQPEPNRSGRHQLYELGSQQGGYFTAQQAQQSGVSSQLLRYYTQTGELQRAMRGIYRLAFFPPHEDEQLVQFWLWSDTTGVFSHETALALYQLSDILPALVHLTLPPQWQTKRLKIPARLRIHYNALDPQETRFYGSVLITNPTRTLLDCIQTHSSPEMIEQAVIEAIQRGLFASHELRQHAQERKLSLPPFVESLLTTEKIKP